MNKGFTCVCGCIELLHTGRFDGQENWYPTACDGCDLCVGFRGDNLKHLERLSVEQSQKHPL